MFLVLLSYYYYNDGEILIQYSALENLLLNFSAVSLVDFTNVCTRSVVLKLRQVKRERKKIEQLVQDLISLMTTNKVKTKN